MMRHLETLQPEIQVNHLGKGRIEVIYREPGAASPAGRFEAVREAGENENGDGTGSPLPAGFGSPA